MTETGTLRRYARHFGWLIVLVLAVTRPSSASQTPTGMKTCAALNECLKLLDSMASTMEDGESLQDDEVSLILQKFGEPAKQELFRRVAGSNRGWRNLAGAILEDWGNWSPADVPPLRSGLQRDPGGWSARPLREIGTPEAIQALIEDVPRNSEGNQTDFALLKLGPKIVPLLMPLLEDKKTAESAQRVIGEMDESALPFAIQWAQLATDPSKSLKLRLGALRGVAAFGSKARSASEGLPPLLSSPDSAIRTEVDATLRATRNPAVIHEVARSCYPRANRFDPMAIDALLCLREIAAYGDDGLGAGEELMPFLSSQNGAERADAITTLAAIGYKTAMPQITAALSSPDWRVTYAAIRAIGWLGDKDALPELQKIASNHWLPEVRDEATRTMAALHSPKGRLEGTWKFIPSDEEVGASFEIDAEILDKEPPCSSQSWVWNGATVALAPSSQAADVSRDTSVEFPNGKLLGTNRGEFGGTLAWKALDRNTKSMVIFQDDVVGIAKDGDGAIVLFALSHMGFEYGYVLHADRTSDDQWVLSEVARLPGKGEGLTTVAPGIFAALSRNRVVVFTRTGILGMAACDSR